MLWLLLPLAVANSEPTDHTVLYYNARMALREGRTAEAVKLWLLRNALESRTKTVSAHDPDFHSVTWAALGEMGLCQDGYPKDNDGGVGLWPVALHNWTVKNMRRRNYKKPAPFNAFKVGRQQRSVSLIDVLNKQELRTLEFQRGKCLEPKAALLDAGELPTAKFTNRRMTSRFLRYLLQRSRETLVADRVRGRSVIEARLFDIGLQLTQLAEREERLKARKRAAQGRQLGLSRAGAQAIKEEAPTYAFSPNSEPAQILRACLDWPTSEWMALSDDRRLFLYDHARAYGGEPEKLERLALSIIDSLIETNRGDEVAAWIAHRPTGETVGSKESIWGGNRGDQLMTLDQESGFRERSVIALHRGIQQLESGDLDGALRSMAYALQTAPQSSESEAVQSLSLRWIAYISAQFELTDELLAMLKEMVPRRDYSVILEDLQWHSAFYADQVSFDRGIRNQLGRGALGRRLRLLEPLAAGNVGDFGTGIRDALDDSPSEALRFLKLFVQRLERENFDVRTAQLSTIDILRDLLRPLSEANKSGRQTRTAGELRQRLQAIKEGLVGLEENASAADKARSIGPSGEVFAGAVRLAPSDPLPWPFLASKIAAPSVFTPVRIRPLEWRHAGGDRVFGWSITE